VTNNIDVFTLNLDQPNNLLVNITLMNRELKFQIDTGAAISIMSQKQWEEIGSPRLKQTILKPTNFDGSVIETLGEIESEISVNNKNTNAKFIVVKSDKNYGLIGRNIINIAQSKFETYHIDEYLPTIKNFEATISLIDKTKPLRFFRARPVPVHLKDKINLELDSLEKQGIITPVSCSTHASPVVWIKKSNGRFRLCVDFKATLNSNIKSDVYPLPTIDEISARIGDAKFFAKLDLKSAYWQIALSKEAKELSIINTNKGLYCLNRLQMGMKNASAIFQKCIESILKGIDGVVVYQDDVLLFAQTETQIKRIMKRVNQRLRDNNVTINVDKSVLPTNSLKFLGYIFSSEGMKSDPSLVQKIQSIPIPKNNKELCSFLGLINYYARFVENFAEICKPLYDLKRLERESYQWTNKCNKSFELLKEKMVSAPVLQPYSLRKPTILTVDASQQSLGAVLSQEGHPNMFISRTLNDTEKRYSNIEREALAVLWACKRLENFLLGRKFAIRTDNNPLTYILNPEIPCKVDISPRLLKISLKMMRYDYTISHVKGKHNVIADTLSRMQCTDNVKLPEINFFCPSIDLNILCDETNRDKFLSNIKQRIITGNWKNTTAKENHYRRMALKLSVDKEGLIRMGSKIILPESLYRKIFDHAHQTHNGTQSTVSMIQQEFFWPFMYRTVEDMVRACHACSKGRFNPVNQTYTWPKDDMPWTRVHIDWAFVRGVGNILVVIDSMSGWLEAVQTRDRTTNTVVIVLRSIFARLGVPFTLVSDNAPEFSNQQFRDWLSSISCRLVHTPEYRPQANGVAERMVRVLKSGLRCFDANKSSIAAYLQRLLFVHRNSALRQGRTPAEIIFGRKIRCPIITHYSAMQNMLYRANKTAPTNEVRMLFKKGVNTSLVADTNGRTVLAHDSQLISAPNVEEDERPIQRPERDRRPVRRYPDIDPRNEGWSV